MPVLPPQLRILHLTSSLKIGGAETVLVSLLRELAGSQSLITVNQVLYFHAGPQVAALQALAQTHPATCYSPQQIQGQICLYDPRFWWCLYWQTRRFQPDLIHSQLWSANIAARILGKLLGVPVINTLHSPVITNGPFEGLRLGLTKLSYYCRRLCDWLTVKWAARLVAVSPSTARALAPDCRGQALVVISNGVAIGDLRLPPARSHFTIGCVGRLVASKNFGAVLVSLAELAPKYPPLRLIGLGTGPLELELKQQAQALGVADLVQWLVTPDVAAYYPQFDCLVQPSWYEGLSLALLEAGAAGLPCIVSGANGHDLITDQVNGLLVGLDAAAALTAAIERLILDPQLRVNLGHNLRTLIAQKYSLAAMVAQYQQLYLAVWRPSQRQNLAATREFK